MNIYIDTIIDKFNYGNRLQNHALHVLLAQYGVPSTIWRVSDYEKKLHHRLGRLKRAVLLSCGAGLSNFKKREKRTNDFVFLDCPYVTDKGKNFEVLLEGEDSRIVIGSDQVWNYTWLTESDAAFRLGTPFDESRLLTYAASIGLDEIEDRWRPIFKYGWSRIPHISVREDRAAELIKEISGRDATVVLDPTLMLTQDQWRQVFTQFVSLDDRFVLTYFLGKPSKEQEGVINAVASRLDVRVRRVNDPDDRETFVAGPADFVELISKAQYVFTDSFHACCFSLLFNRPFKVFDRADFAGKSSMNSRMRTLFRLFEIDDLMVDDQALPTYDWHRINTLLEHHRASSRVWLENALGIGAGVTHDA